MRDSKAEFQFIDFARHKPIPDPLPEPSEAELSKERATHRGALFMIAVAFLTYIGICWGMGWLS